MLLLGSALITAFSDAAPIAGSRVVEHGGAAALLGVLCAWVHLFSVSGYRRLPFWLASGCGTLLAAAAIGFGSGASGAAELAAAAGALLGTASVHQGVALAVAAAAFIVARWAMAQPLLNAGRFAVLFTAAFAAGLLLPAWAGPAVPANQGRITYRGELDELFALLHPAYREYREDVEEYIEELAADETIDAEEKRRLIAELNERIEALQSDVERYRAAEQEREAYAEEVERLRRRLVEIEARAVPEGGLSAEDLQRVTSYREAVRPAVPLVRDFAVQLAAEHPGSYYLAPNSRMPSREGLLQVLTIHRYVASRWRYVNDPLFIRGNYYSPADRTIAVGLVGDCDDFATLMASAVEAIGGRARILHGICAEGAHAWAEVYIGNAAAWQQALSILARRYPGRRISYITPRHGNDYWLSLDWQVGVYSCGNSPALQYQSG
ncbi:MAG: hypothetical protein EA384_17040 [Spirochaetaceae bacterium]|nr:MAG: hypothetical protein EA384_17040 [Spirochaetaceae bacterium]